MFRRLLHKAEPVLLKAYQRMTHSASPSLEGDRDVEYSWIEANCPPGPGRGLDFGCGTSHMALMAARRGFEMTAIDLRAIRWPYTHPGLAFAQTDLFDLPLKPASLDLVINCSTVEHIGLGRYGDASAQEGDLRAMERLRETLADGGTMLLTIPVGQDAVFDPWHRIYGPARLPRLLSGLHMEKEEFWVKGEENRWIPVGRDEALARPAKVASYGLGCFVLRKGGRPPKAGRS